MQVMVTVNPAVENDLEPCWDSWATEAVVDGCLGWSQDEDKNIFGRSEISACSPVHGRDGLAQAPC